MKFTHILIHYAEIGLKGKNRPFFEKKLVENIKKSFKRNGVDIGSVSREYGRIIVNLPDNPDLGRLSKSLKNVFGIANFSYARRIPSEMEEIKKAAVGILENEDFKTFKSETRRSDKKFPVSSMEVDKEVGEIIVNKMGKEVDLDSPERTVFIEITEEGVFVYLEKQKGLGGLPVGTSSKAVILLSGGIDSPVAAYLMNKRGVKNIFVHFHSYPYTSRESVDKARKIVELLNKYQFQSKLYLVPFAEIQKEILDKAPEPLRIILYRRFMFRISERIAEKEKTNALTTGESIGQVSSQTLENIKSISEAIDIPILRPLVGFDKEEIVNLSKEIGTYETSILPCEDACTWFAPQNPETKSSVSQVKKAEENLDIEKLVEKGVESTELEKVPKKVS